MAAPRKAWSQCCVAGGGPAGMMLGFLLARAGVDVLVLEKHADFLRDFRGDTIHPSTLEVMHELGLLDDFLKRPHQEGASCAGFRRSSVGRGLSPPAPAAGSSRSFRNGISSISSPIGQRVSTFRFRMRSEVNDLIVERGESPACARQRPTARSKSGPTWWSAADGRHSIVRERAGLRGARSRRADRRFLVAAVAAAE